MSYITVNLVISIHSPRVGRDGARMIFLQCRMNFNPLSPRGERHINIALTAALEKISIHSPRVGRDRILISSRTKDELFQSTLPAWGETIIYTMLDYIIIISIHSPRVGRDFGVPYFFLSVPISIHSPRVGRDVLYDMIYIGCINFNPLSPRGERHCTMKN